MAGVTIVQGPFKIVQCEDDSYFWDFYQLHKASKKDGTTEDVWKIRAYGITLSSAIIKIIKIMTAHKLKDQPVTLREFLNEFLKNKKEILHKFNVDDLVESKFIDNEYVKSKETLEHSST